MPVVGSTAYSQTRAVTSLIRSILNDANLQANAAVLIAAIERSAGVVQVTTIGPHGLLVGDQSQIANVPIGTNTFNGVFYVNTVINPTQYTYVQAGANESQSSGLSMGVGLGAVWTDGVLMPYVNSAYRKVQRALANIGDPGFVEDDALFVVPAVSDPDPSVQVSITDATAPPNQLPSNLLQPLKLWERPNGTSQDFFEMTDITNKGGLPSRLQDQVLGVWEWRSDGLFFIGAVQDTQVRMRYQAAMADLVDGSSSILIRGAQDAIAFLACGIIGGSRGNPMAKGWDDAGMDHLEDVINQNARKNQRVGTRRRPFSSRSGWSPF